MDAISAAERFELQIRIAASKDFSSAI